MSIITDYALNTVTRTPRGTLQGDGTYDFSGAATSIKARITDKQQKQWSSDRWEVIYDRIFWVAGDVTVNMGDRLTWDSVAHEVVDVRVGRFMDNSINHKKIMCKIVGV